MIKQKKDRLAHFPPHLFNSSPERWNGIQSDAGAVATFIIQINFGYIHASNHTSGARGAGSSDVVGIRFQT
jgi:hypothetical protein